MADRPGTSPAPSSSEHAIGPDNAIGKAVTLLKALRVASNGGSARELAATTGIPRSTVQRTLAALAGTGMVEQDPGDARYRIGPQALLIGLGYKQGLSLVNAARPVMLRLRDVTGETVGLSVSIGDARVFIDEVQSQAQLRFASELGRLYPLWAGANGRVLMMDLADEERERILADRSLGDAVFAPLPLDRERAALDRVRADGYAIAVNETIANVSSVAVPVRDATSRVLAALSVSGPTERLTRDRLADIRPPLLEAAAQLSETLGARPTRGG